MIRSLRALSGRAACGALGFGPLVMRVLALVVALAPPCRAQAEPAPTHELAPVDSARRRAAPRPSLLLGLGLSLTAYQGDLTTLRGLQSPGAGGHLSLEFAPGGGARGRERRVRLQLAGGWGAFQADDRTLPPVGGRQGNRFVNTRLWYVGLNALYHPLRRPLALGDYALRPRLSAGLALLNFTPRDAQGQPLAEQLASRAPGESFSTGALMLPLGLGLALQHRSGWGLALDYHYALTATPYLDNLDQLGRGTGADRLHRFTLALLVPL